MNNQTQKLQRSFQKAMILKNVQLLCEIILKTEKQTFDVAKDIKVALPKTTKRKIVIQQLVTLWVHVKVEVEFKLAYESKSNKSWRKSLPNHVKYSNSDVSILIKFTTLKEYTLLSGRTFPFILSFFTLLLLRSAHSSISST